MEVRVGVLLVGFERSQSEQKKRNFHFFVLAQNGDDKEKALELMEWKKLCNIFT